MRLVLHILASVPCNPYHSSVAELRDRLQAALGDAYRIERELGGGGMSRVFLAEEVRLGRQVVVKVLPPEMAAGVSADRFEREIQLAAKLQHPHIVPLLTAGARGDLLYYVMPHIAGESLRARLAHERELPVVEAARILRDVCDALAYAHGHGIVHRDIKPDNVLLSGKHALVTDFGVAKAVSQSKGSGTLTSLGMALGTPAYMAPEQAAGDPQVDHRADLYAVGALGYELLAGRTDSRVSAGATARPARLGVRGGGGARRRRPPHRAVDGGDRAAPRACAEHRRGRAARGRASLVHLAPRAAGRRGRLRGAGTRHHALHGDAAARDRPGGDAGRVRLAGASGPPGAGGLREPHAGLDPRRVAHRSAAGRSGPVARGSPARRGHPKPGPSAHGTRRRRAGRSR